LGLDGGEGIPEWRLCDMKVKEMFTQVCKVYELTLEAINFHGGRITPGFDPEPDAKEENLC